MTKNQGSTQRNIQGKTIDKNHYKNVSRAPNFPQIEEEILQYWQRENIFQRSLDQNLKSRGEVGKIDAAGGDATISEKTDLSKRDPGIHSRKDSPAKKNFIFYDGPPFANGLPHYGHLVTGFIKDIIPRYQTMRGSFVERRFGWDTHGLPAELQAEKMLKLSGRMDIQRYGIQKFNDYCKKDVLRFAKEWEYYVNRQARWVDFDHDYKTMDFTYMESVIWAFKTLWERGLIYEDFRVVPYSWATESPLSNFEIRLDNATRPRQDPAVTVLFKLKIPLNIKHISIKINTLEKAKPIYIAAWTTTPWTLTSNLALAVGNHISYAVLENNNATYLFSTGVLAKYKKEIQALSLEQTATILGENLHDISYEPLFPYFRKQKNAFRIFATDWVDDKEGTGCVHMAPGFGEIDMMTCRQHGIDLVVPVDSRGHFTEAVADFNGQHVFDSNKPIASLLRHRRRLIRFETYVHNYPHCWRTDTPIIYRAIHGWYLKVEAFKDRMVELNNHINWIPHHLQKGQFGRWLENARDWNISRERFWGTPIPVWKSDDPNYPRIDVYGSFKELQKDFSVTQKELHRPHIDSLVRPNPNDPTKRSTMRRVAGILDCWFDSGSMPFAQLHYPFDNKERFEKNFPGDFITEYQAQTRGWFYTLMVMSTALFDRAPFKNCLCHGVVLDERQQKLSKRLKNYPDPLDMFNKHGADAMRWYMVASPLMIGGDLAIDRQGKAIDQTVRRVLMPLWNAYYFFTLYANAEGIKSKTIHRSPDVMDTYILSKLRVLTEQVTAKMDAFALSGATHIIDHFLDVMNNWYIRRNRQRFWAHNSATQHAFDTLYTVLTVLCKVAAPFLPMITEKIYRGLTDEDSVHFAQYPDVSNFPLQESLMRHMDRVRHICSSALAIRESKGIRVRQPLQSLTIVDPNVASIEPFLNIIKEEVNVKNIVIDAHIQEYGVLQLVVDPKIGRRIGSQVKEILKAAKIGDWQYGAEDTIVVAGQTLSKKEYTLCLKTTGENASHTLSDGRGAIILDTHITKELEIEGLARDAVRLIQNTRRDKNFSISDRIILTVETSGKLFDAFSQHAGFIKKEVLAKTMQLYLYKGSKAVRETTIASQLCGTPITLLINKVTTERN